VRPHRVRRPEELEDVGPIDQLQQPRPPLIARPKGRAIAKVDIAQGGPEPLSLPDDFTVDVTVGGEDPAIWARLRRDGCQRTEIGSGRLGCASVYPDHQIDVSQDEHTKEHRQPTT
jgi:hypothetical protein